MNNVLLIIKRELGSYFRTPSGYIIGGVMLLWLGLTFNVWAVGDEPRLSSEVLEQYLMFAGGTVIVMGALFSMRLLAEERAAGTQTLLLTSPISEWEIVVGKFLASFAFVALVILVSLYLPALIFINGKVSLGHIAAGYLGLILLGGSTLALGMLASSLTKHPFVAVLLAGLFAAVLNFTFFIARKVESETLSEFVAYLSPYYSHFMSSSFQTGILQVSDLVYYSTLIYASLFAATRVLRSERWQ